MKKILLLTSLFALVLSIPSFAQNRPLLKKKSKPEVMVEKTEKDKMTKSEFDCQKLDLQVTKKENQYEVVLNSEGSKPHHWDLIPLSRSESNSRSRISEEYTIQTTKRNKITVSKNGKYLMNVMSAEDDILCSTPLNLVESNSRGFNGYIHPRWNSNPKYNTNYGRSKW